MEEEEIGEENKSTNIGSMGRKLEEEDEEEEPKTKIMPRQNSRGRPRQPRRTDASDEEAKGKKKGAKEEQEDMLQVIKRLQDQLITKMIEKGSRYHNEPNTLVDEALAPYLLAKEYPIGWRRPKLSTYNRKTDCNGSSFDNFI